MTEFRALAAHALPYKGQLFLLSGLTISASLATLAVPWLAGNLLGGAFMPERVGIDETVTLLIIALLSVTLLNISAQILAATTSARILSDLRVDIYSHLQCLPMSFHDARRKGDLLALGSNEIPNLSDFITYTLTTIPSTILTAGGAVVILFRIDPALSILVPILVPVFYFLLKIIGRQLRGLARLSQQAEAAVMAQAEENLEMLPAIKAETRENARRDSYAGLVNVGRALSVSEAKILAVLGPTIGLVAAIAAVALILGVGQKVNSGTMSPAEMFSFLFYAALLTRPASSIADLYGRTQTARGTLSRLQDVLRWNIEAGYHASGRLERVDGKIEFCGVCFSYPGRKKTLEGLNLVIAPGETVAITGDNGAGKSTLVALLMRFYDPDEGEIRLDGQDISGIQIQALRRQIGYVPQRALLFNGSIYDNIAFGLEGATLEQVLSAARLSQAYDFIIQLPDGFDTEVGDNGVRLSGGERQRIALARALIHDPTILILDEATSMYDLEGEAAFIKASEVALEGRTVLLITHRKESLALADRIFSLQNETAFEGNANSALAR